MAIFTLHSIFKDVEKNSIINCEKEFTCTKSHVTDNTFNATSMHTQLQTCYDLNMITYGYSVLLLNLLAEGLNILNIKEQTLIIVNFLRNHHFANAKYNHRE